jgi:hypothetical protein
LGKVDAFPAGGGSAEKTDNQEGSAIVMTEQRKIVKGGFRATLALIIAMIAIITSVVAYNHDGENNAMREQIDKLKATVQDVKNETSQRLDQVRQETASALQNLGKSLKGEKEQK